MPRYYCDYCDTYLTHDSPSVRKQHNAGYKHKANVRNYYQQFEEQQTQSLIDQKVKEHLGQTAAFQQVGAAFHQHIAALQSGQYKPPISVPVLPPPTLPIPGSIPGSTAPLRPLVLPRPPGSSPGYSLPSVLRPPTSTGETNGFSQLSTLTPPGAPGAPGVRPVMTFSSTPANGPMSSMSTPATQQQHSSLANGSYGSYPPVSGPSIGNYTQQDVSAPTTSSQYGLQQPFRPMVPSGSFGQISLGYGQDPAGPPGGVS